MRILPTLLLASSAVAIVLSNAGSASALGPVDIEVAARGGVSSSPTGDSPNPTGVGIGGRAGVSVIGLYGGGSVMYYFGHKATNADGTSFSVHTLMYGLEGGYSIGVPLFTIRPQVGIGNFSVTGSCSSCGGSSNNLYVEPGVVALLTLGTFLLGADVDLLYVPNFTDPQVAVVGNLQAGIKF